MFIKSFPSSKFTLIKCEDLPSLRCFQSGLPLALGESDVEVHIDFNLVSTIVNPERKLQELNFS